MGPGGQFLTSDHTLEHFKQELWFPSLLDRHYWSQWMESGAQSMRERCIEIKERMLRDHPVAPLEDNLAGELDRIVACAKDELHHG